MPQNAATQLQDFIDRHPKLTVLVGAGCSTASGIPEYRDDNGNWMHPKPVEFADFIRAEKTRKRYWARSLAGWNRIASAKPNAAHLALAELERKGFVDTLVTQNVDNLHRRAGSLNIIDLHGVLDKVRCLDCGAVGKRSVHQDRLLAANPGWSGVSGRIAPDGDAQPGRSDFGSFVVPACLSCAGVLKPDVVFFGESVPSERVQAALDALARSEALLIVGSSLMVFSGFRFARTARESGKPIAIVNRGVTRADDIATTKFSQDCAKLLPAVVQRMAA